MKKVFQVGGMTCSACSSGIERNVSRLDGVNSVAVSLMDKSMTVDYDENLTSAEKIVAVVEKLANRIISVILLRISLLISSIANIMLSSIARFVSSASDDEVALLICMAVSASNHSSFCRITLSSSVLPVL